jgi:hypothetical protein
MLEITEEIIGKYLEQDENLIWSGKPRSGIVFRSSDIFMIPFSLMWGGFAIVWEIMAIAIPKDEAGPVAIIFPLFGIPFVIAGLYLIFGRFIVDARQRDKTYYGITNQRIIIISGIFSQNIQSLNLKTLSDISISEKTDGTGTITFGPTNPMSFWFSGTAWPGSGRYSSPSFSMIENAKQVYDTIRSTQNTLS